MGKVFCSCGYCISDVAMPSPCHGYLVSQVQYDDWQSELNDECEIIPLIKILDGQFVCECCNCGSIAIEKDKKLYWYKSVNNEVNRVIL